VQELESRQARQEKQIASMAAALQKVSAQIEMSGSGPEVVENRESQPQGTARTE
jgi:4-diphosphocytidyl-2C-methyl-D-erythritol kinase